MSDPFAMLDDLVIEHFGFECRVTDTQGSVIIVRVDVDDSFLDIHSGDVMINANEPKIGGKGLAWITQSHELEIEGKRYRVDRDPDTDIYGWTELQVSRIYDSD